MKITYDRKAKAVYIYLKKEAEKVNNTTKITSNLYIDYSVEDEPVGIEILDVEDIPVVEEIR